MDHERRLPRLAQERPDLVDKLSSADIRALKDEAYRRRIATGGKLHQHLREVAAENGYPKWEQLMMMNRGSIEATGGLVRRISVAG
jgi:hypothetical protein